MAMERYGQAMADAMIERPVGTLSERVATLLRARTFGVTAAAEVARELRALDEGLGARFWKQLGGYRQDDSVIVEIISAVRALEPKLPEPRPSSWSDIIPA